jgi:hypothetical protein
MISVPLLQHRVLNQFLLDHVGELELVQREQVHHLDEARGEYLFLLNLKVQFVFEKSHS